MRTITLGDTDTQVSALCLGAMLFGTKIDRETSFRLLDLYVESGGTFIDTANVYASWIPGFKGGESEALLGQWMRERGNRERLFIATKMGSRLQPSGRGLRREQINEECEKSLKRLGLETIDLYYSHFYCPTTPAEETMAAFDALRKAGKIRLLGASNHPSWRLAESNTVARLQGWTSYCCIQQRLSYIRPRPTASFGVQVAANADLLDYCRERRVTPLAYSPLLGGVYARPDRKLTAHYAGPDADARLAAIRSLAQQKGMSANTLVLAWMLNHDPVILPIFAVSSENQMRENLGALEVKLSEEEMKMLHGAGA